MTDAATTDSPSSDLARHWTLDPQVTFLNHGSFGACPRAVLEVQSDLRSRMEAEPVRFFVRELEALAVAARGALAAFVGADAEGLAFVANATTGVNTVLAATELRPGDEVLITDHEYPACRNAAEIWAARSGARVVVASVPFPLDSPDEVVEAILSQAGPRTRLALIDHVTSQTALVFPVADLVRELEGRGIPVVVDGAHAPGMIDLDLAALGASYYTGNCHKWLCAPKGAAFLWVRRDRRAGIRPLVISHGATAPLGGSTRFRLEFDWTGTGDFTAALSVPAAIETVGGLVAGGWPAIRRRNRDLALAARRTLCEALEIPPPCPDAMIGSMASLPLPDGRPSAAGQSLPPVDPLQDRLFFDHSIEVPVIAWPAPPKRLLRVSAQLYNTCEQYEALARALGTEISS